MIPRAAGWALLLAGCLDRILEAPYLLAPGLGEARSVGPGLDGRLLVAASTGVYAVDGEGRAERIDAKPADAVTVHPGRVHLLRMGRVESVGIELGGALGEASPDHVVDVPGAVDILAGYDALAVLHPDRLDLLDLGRGGARRTLVNGLQGARAVALGAPLPDGSGTYLVVTATSLLQVAADGAITTLADGLKDARAAAVDAKGRVYVAQGEPKALWRVDGPGAVVSVASWLGEPRDLHFGMGGLLSPENVYVANGAGTLDYIRPP